MVAKDRLLWFPLMALFVMLISSGISAQTHSKIFTSEEADKYYGPVLDSLKMPTETLRGLLEKTTGVIMFEYKDSSLVILGDNRTVLFPEGAIVDSSRVFRAFAKKTTVELLDMDKSETIFIQQRPSALTISNGLHVMEISVPCPPFCAE